ncbi:MarR family winged helix-turn-helix transcriptional regulator [Streptococcus marimammalium]|uniref:MarR family winged helix-turn-helix transcriptional regulator n=1 Tax=Streptococcus marimammalium TaxID=269666 RepID=UPI0003822A41|nr:MarR family transcriptional regulator [Streptococcus marimammalium]
MTRQELALKTFIGLKRISDKFEQAVKHDVQAYDLNSSEFAVLELLYHKGPKTMQEIKERILVANSSTTYTLDKLCQKKLVERRTNPEDKRITQVYLLSEGKELIASSFPKHAEMLTKLFDNLEDEEIKTLNNLLKKLSSC